MRADALRQRTEGTSHDHPKCHRKSDKETAVTAVTVNLSVL